jgi:hypothetical protein
MGCNVTWLWRRISATRWIFIGIPSQHKIDKPAVGFENRPLRWHTHKLDLTYSCSSWFSVSECSCAIQSCTDGFQLLVITHTSLTYLVVHVRSKHTHPHRCAGSYIGAPSNAASIHDQFISTRGVEDRASERSIDNVDQQWYIGRRGPIASSN